MPEFHADDSLVPQKYGVLSPFAKFTWCMVVVIVVGVFSLLVFKFDLERLRGSTYFISKARQAVASQDWGTAVSAMQHVQGTDRDGPEFLRVVADYLEATQSEPALLDSILSKLEAMGLMQPADYLWACRLQLATRKIDQARKALDRIPAQMRSGVEALKLSIVILNEEGRLSEAAAEEAKLIQLFPNDPEVILRVATRDLEGTFPEFQQAALKKLWALAEQPSDVGLNAIQVLSERVELTLAEATRLLDLADKQPGITPGERLRVVSVILKLDPAHRGKLIDAEIARYHSKDLKILAQLASWLAQEKEYDRLMLVASSSPLVSKDELLQTAEIFPMIALGLAEQARWSDLMDLLKQGKKPLPVPKARAAAWRALATRNLEPEDTRETRFHLEEALREGNAEKNHSAVFETARLAEDWGMPDLALKAYEALAVPGSKQEQGMLEKCLQMAVLLKDSAAQLRLAERLASLMPSNLLLTHRRDYLKLLLGTDIETTTLAGDLPSDSSDAHSIRKLLEALRAYRLHDQTLAFTIIRSVQNTGEMSTGERAVYAGILAESGETRKAYDLAEQIRPELLLHEEISFLNKAL